MIELKKKLKFEKFLENTTIHGIIYLNTKNNTHKIFWLFILLFFSFAIVLSTTLMVQKYLKFNEYLIAHEIELNKLDSLPNLVLCRYDSLTLRNSVEQVRPFLKSVYEYADNLLKQQSIYNLDLKNFVKQYLQLINETNNEDNFDRYFISDLKSYIERNLFKIINSCYIQLKHQLLDCKPYIEALFTFNGPCLVINLKKLLLRVNNSELEQSFDPLSHYSRKKIALSLNLNIKIYSYIYYSFHENNYPYSMKQTKLFMLNTKRMINYYEITRVRETYALEGVKCLRRKIGYDESLCHYECLCGIIKTLLNCDFSLEFEETHGENDFKHCKLRYMVIIEFIIKNYSKLKDRFGVCSQQCLPNCEVINYKINEIVEQKWDSVSGQWNIYFKFKSIEIKHVLEFELLELLSFINGLWSLFLGISLLSIWELFEFIYTINDKYFNKNCYFNYLFAICDNLHFTSSTRKTFKKINNVLKQIFEDSYFHGIKYLFQKDYKASTKIRWFLVIFLVFIALLLSINNSINSYRAYNTDTKVTMKLVKYTEHTKRTLKFFICVPIIPEMAYKDIYFNLSTMANNLFSYNYSFNDMIDVYVNYLNYLVANSSNSSLFKTFKMDALDISRLYNQIYIEQNISLALRINSNETIYNGTMSIYLYETCSLFDLNLNTKNVTDFIYKIWTSYSKIDIYSRFIYSLAIIDSESQHISSDDTWYQSLPKGITIYLSMKKSRYLNEPYQPNCNSEQYGDYRQHVCLKQCINDIISKIFGCYLIYEKILINKLYCHPFIIPLIRAYTVNYLNNKQALHTICSRCKTPCEAVYFEINQIQQVVASHLYGYLEFSLVVDDHMYDMEQIAIITLYDTVMIIISYISLFLGGSCLALIQIPFNIASISVFKAKNSTKLTKSYFKNNFTIELLSKLSTIHCIKYINMSETKLSRIIFWSLALFSTLITIFIYSSIEIKNFFIIENEIYHMKELKFHKFKLPKIDICETRDMGRTFDVLKSFNLNKILKNREVFIKQFINEPLPYHGYNFSIKHYIFENFNKYNTIMEQIKSENKSLFDNIMKIRFSESDINYFPTLENIKLSNQMPWLNNGKILIHSNTYNYHTGMLYQMVRNYYSKFSMLVDKCTTLNITSLYNDSFHFMEFNPFIKLDSNQITIHYNRYLFDTPLSAHTDIYIDNTRIDFYLPDSYSYFYLQLNKYIHHEIYNDKCKSDKNCISAQKTLYNYSDYQLFFCNNEFRDSFYDVFNCTPFYNHSNAYELSLIECPAIYIPLINELFLKFRKNIFNCNIDFDKFPYQFSTEQTFYSNINNGIILDFNNLRLFDNSLQTYSVLKLIINLSNFYNITIGFSFITIIEIGYLCFINRHNRKTAVIN